MASLFVSETAIKDASIINENVDNKKITPLIIECQDVYIMPILGSGIYAELQTQIDTSSVTSANKTLLDSYIIPCLKAYIKYEAPLELSYTFSNKVGKKKSDNEDALSLSEIESLQDKFKHKAEFYAEKITKFLRRNHTLYPLYYQPGTGWDVVFPANSNYRTGMILDDNWCNSCGGVCGCRGIQWGNQTIDL